MACPRFHRSILAASLLALSLALLLAPNAAQAAVGYPNPAPNAYILLNGTGGVSSGSRQISFADPTAPVGTTYNLYVWRTDQNPLPDSQAVYTDPNDTTALTFPPAQTPVLIKTFTKLNVAQGTVESPFVYPGTGDPALILETNRAYSWRVDTNGATGTVWNFFVPMNEPAQHYQYPGTITSEVSVYPTLKWEPQLSTHYNEGIAAPAAAVRWKLSGTPVREKLLLILNDVPGERRWAFQSTATPPGAPTLNTAAIVKEYIPNNSGRAGIREFGPLDAGYARLLSGHQYKWRVVLCDNNGNPLYRNLDGSMSGTNPTFTNGDCFAWADGGDDSARGVNNLSANGWYFRTMSPTPVVSNTTIESLVVYWQSQYGNGARDPVEGDYTFRSVAQQLQSIHQSTHDPVVPTLILSTEEITSAYGGTGQPAWVDPITQYPGWYSYADRTSRSVSGGFGTTAQDRYEEWFARALRTYLRDATNVQGFGVGPDRADLPNLQYVTLIGDGDRVAPSFYSRNSWTQFTTTYSLWSPTDFFYSTQDSGGAVQTTPRYQIGRIPLRVKGKPTVTENGQAYDVELPVITKLRNYALLLNSDSKKNAAYTQWFGRAAVFAGESYYINWYQFFAGFAQEFLSNRVSAGAGLFRDTFSGIKVRKYDIFGASGSGEELDRSTVLKHVNNPAQADVTGFVYLLTRGDAGNSDSGHHIDAWGDNADLWGPYPTYSGSFTDALRSSDLLPTYVNDPTDGRRPILVAPGALLARFDNALWDTSTTTNPPSIGESALLAAGGPIAVVGFDTTSYNTTVNYQRTYPQGNHSFSWIHDTDQLEGYEYTQIVQGTLAMLNGSDPDTAIRGKIAFTQMFADEYAMTTQPVLGTVFIRALTDYLNRFATEFAASDGRELTTVFGATLLGDPVLLLPTRQRPTADNTRPVVVDTNIRTATNIPGYGVTPQYNRHDMPIHEIPRTDPFDPSVGSNIVLRIQSNAPFVRIRIMTPFRTNNFLPPVRGYWNDASGNHWTSNDSAIVQTTNSQALYTFQAKTPSVYIALVQAQNPAWVNGVDQAEYRWLQERWFYLQAVNTFVRDPASNILVVDSDQIDRFHLNGYHLTNRENYYVNPSADGEGYGVGQDPLTFISKPALPVLNKGLGEDMGDIARYKYQFWSTNVYRTGALNATALRDGQRFYGDITPAALKSFVDSVGAVIWFHGDSNTSNPSSFLSYQTKMWPHGYLFDAKPLEIAETDYLTNFITNGGRLWLTSQNLAGWGDTLPNLIPFQEDVLGAITRTRDTDYTNMDGFLASTFSQTIGDVNIAGGDGSNSAFLTAELDPNGTESRSAFLWDVNSGPGTSTGTRTSAIANRYLITGARVAYMTWPFEAIDHIGNFAADASGRANVARQVIDWLRSVPKTSGPDPFNGEVGVVLDKTLSWNRVPEALSYRLFLGTNPATFDDLANAITIDRDNPRYTPAGGLLQDTQYFWRVDTRNVDDFTIGDVWTFNTVAPAPVATNPVPANGASQVPLDQVFSWTASPLVDEYDITIFNSDSSVFESAINLTSATFTPSALLSPNTTYVWRVDSRNSLGTTNGTLWGFSTLTPPPAPTVSDPTNGATSVASNKVLGWGATVRTDGYDIFVWRTVDSAPTTDETPAAFNARTGTTWSGSSLTNTYSPGELQTPNVPYSWQVRPFNAAGRQNTISTWTFTTGNFIGAPAKATNPVPANGAFGVGLNPILMWDKAAGAIKYDVTFWRNTLIEPATPNSINQAGTSFTPTGPLVLGATYNWRVNSKNSQDAAVLGDVWTFTVGPEKTTGHIPVDGAVDVSPSVTLDWADARGADSYNIFIWRPGVNLPPNVGETPAAYNTRTSTSLSGASVTSDFKPAVDLLVATVYNWRVDSVTISGAISIGDVLSFTTGTATGLPNQVTGHRPRDGATGVAQDTALSWNPAIGAASYNLYLSAANGGIPAVPTVAGLTVTRFQPPALLTLGATYQWRVDSVGSNPANVTIGQIVQFIVETIAGGGAGGGGGGACFVATSAYEMNRGIGPVLDEANCTGLYLITPERLEKLNDIRRLRDVLLLKAPAGRSFSAWYYAVGPYAATAIRHNEPAKAAVRAMLLDPLSGLSRGADNTEK